MPPVVSPILVVDDFPDGREMVAEYLTFRGFSVVQASTGADAIELARKHRPKLILMDLGMPGLDGWETTRQLKADPRTKDCVVIALTAHTMGNQHSRALQAGCADVIAKPFDLATLGDIVDRIVNHRRPSRARTAS
jgi:CheY-like chemotaxis protein